MVVSGSSGGAVNPGNPRITLNGSRNGYSPRTDGEEIVKVVTKRSHMREDIRLLMDNKAIVMDPGNEPCYLMNIRIRNLDL